jgi:hypothetical protein
MICEQMIDEQTGEAATGYWLCIVRTFSFLTSLCPYVPAFPIPAFLLPAPKPRIHFFTSSLIHSFTSSLLHFFTRSPHHFFTRSLALLLPAFPFPRSLAFLTTNHYPLTTAFTPPPHASGTHPPSFYPTPSPTLPRGSPLFGSLFPCSPGP